jgi:hypothetical protein
MYMGEMNEAMPMARPVIISAVISQGMEGDEAVPREPTRKIMPAAMMRLRRPSRSVSAPPSEAPTTAPTSTALTTNSSIVEDRWNCRVMKRIAPEITPVS